MMGPDEVLEHTRNAVLVCKRKSVCNMTDDLLCAFLRTEAFMITYAWIFILSKALRVGDLSDIMIQGSRTNKRDIIFYRSCHRIRQIHLLKRMLECAGSLICKHS